MNLTHLKNHSPIPRNGIYNNSVKLLLALSIYLKSSNISNSTIIDEDCFAAYYYFWRNLFKSVQCVQESMMINKN